MKALILKTSSGQYDEYQETIEEVWIRDEPFNWPKLYAEYRRLVGGAVNENKSKKKNLLPVISLSDFLRANGFIWIMEYDEHMD